MWPSHNIWTLTEGNSLSSNEGFSSHTTYFHLIKLFKVSKSVPKECTKPRTIDQTWVCTWNSMHLFSNQILPKIHQNVHNFHSLSYIIWIWKLFNSFDRSCEKLKSMWVHGMVFRISPLENWGQNVKITTGLALCQNNDDWKPPMKHNMYVSFDRSTTYSATRTLKLHKLWWVVWGLLFSFW